MSLNSAQFQLKLWAWHYSAQACFCLVWLFNIVLVFLCQLQWKLNWGFANNRPIIWKMLEPTSPYEHFTYIKTKTNKKQSFHPRKLIMHNLHLYLQKYIGCNNVLGLLQKRFYSLKTNWKRGKIHWTFQCNKNILNIPDMFHFLTEKLSNEFRFSKWILTKFSKIQKYDSGAGIV